MEQPIKDSDVKRVLGENAYDAILNNVRSGNINGQKMTDIAAMLHPIVCGNTLRRRRESGAHSDDREMRRVLSDWYDREMFDMTRREALNKLVTVLENDNVDLKPLARDLKELMDQNPSEVTKATTTTTTSTSTPATPAPIKITTITISTTSIPSNTSAAATTPSSTSPSSKTSTGTTRTTTVRKLGQIWKELLLLLLQQLLQLLLPRHHLSNKPPSLTIFPNKRNKLSLRNLQPLKHSPYLKLSRIQIHVAQSFHPRPILLPHSHSQVQNVSNGSVFQFV